jgi:predicted phosphohydrolase
MKIIFTSDSHLDFLQKPGKTVRKAMAEIEESGAEVFCILGDTTQGRLVSIQDGILHRLLTTHERTLFIMGNHDLWSRSNERLAPDDALEIHQKELYTGGISMEPEWDNTDTVFRHNGVAFVGTMGFPDFEHPTFKMPAKYYDHRGTSGDLRYMKLSLGWLRYTERIHKAFKQRLKLATEGPEEDIIVMTHYCTFDSQVMMSGDDVSPYFFDHGTGEMIKEEAARHPEKRFWCFGGHSHEYCRGVLRRNADNVWSYGFVGQYREFRLMEFDLEKGENQEPQEKTVIWNS